ncbi:hypothetical protein C8A03DRAFT_19304 [Achaetomium macrosporum]|uniref:FAR1 domain-containing protein n=1 Tax=Achaetomium macrosporum TaxID=79813 RepID=A0AAN7H3S9_9PEZI|nr:hypothetical protein C8A03DRAFT_19304 [Achaetomium macrosporum]
MPSHAPESAAAPASTILPVFSQEQYDSLDALLADLNTWGRSHGLGFTKMRPSNYVNGSPTRYDIACDRGGRVEGSRATIRRTSTARTGCKWLGIAKALVSNGRKGTFEVKHTQHNHETTAGHQAELSTHQVHRGLSDPMKAEIAALSLNPAQKPRDIFSYLKKSYPDVVFT